MTTLMKRNSNGHAPATTFSGLVDQLFQDNLGRFFDDNFWGFDGNTGRSQVPVNIRETDKAYEIQFMAPGVKKEDFKVQVNDGLLTVSFEHKEENNSNDGWLRREFRRQSFSRSFTLQDTVDGENIGARYDNGVLYLTIPKKEPVQKNAKQIQIQ